MISKLVVFGAGYVLGSKAGRDRYNQIALIAREAAKRLEKYGGSNQFSVNGSRTGFRTGIRSGGASKF